MANQVPDPDVAVFPTAKITRSDVRQYVHAFNAVLEERRRFRIGSRIEREVATSHGTFYLVREGNKLSVHGPVELNGRVNVLLRYEVDGEAESAYLEYDAPEMVDFPELNGIATIVALLYPLPEEELPDIDPYLLAATKPITLWDKEDELRAANPNLPLDRKDLEPDGPSLPREGFATRRGFGRW